MKLADTWVDSGGFLRLQTWRSIFARRRPVALPESLPGGASIPKYVLQEFHNLPNGNYSNLLTPGYITGFDFSMLGRVRPVREWMAEQSAASGAALLDVGTSSGKTAAAARRRGVTDVWGLDPSPYLLRHAAANNPEVKFVQGVAEDLPFGDCRFDAITVCFVFHEMPPKAIAAALAEFHRVMKPGARACIAEPSPEQLRPFAWSDLLPLRGWARLYFRALAGFVHEPFINAWHKLDKREMFEEAGFGVEERPGMPIDRWILQKGRLDTAADPV